MKIIHCFREPVGGLFRHVRDLSEAQARAGHEIGLVCDALTGGPAADTSLEQLSPSLSLGLMRIPMRRGIGVSDLLAAWKIGRWIRHLNPDVLHGHGAKGGAYGRSVGTILRATGNGVARIYTPHGGSLHFLPGTALGRIYFTVEKLLARRTDGFVFVSHFEAYSYATKVGAVDRNVSFVHNGLRPEEFEPVSTAADAVDFLFIGALRALKGPDVFIDALARLATRRGAASRALIVGAGEAQAELEGQVNRLGLAETVTFRPPMPAREAFAQAGTVVIPSRAESMPYIVLEALAAGRPLLTTDVGGISEIYGELSKRLLPPGDPDALCAAMMDALDEPSQLKTVSEQLQQRLRSDFSVEVMAEKVLSAYGALVKH
ncbi:MAG: glycosyltransferase [Alphaproteobacteria bacterium]